VSTDSRAAAWRFVGRAYRNEGRHIVAAVGAGLLWQAAAILSPLLIARAIDDGILGGDRRALVGWCAGLATLGLIEAACWGVRHFLAIRNGMRTDAAVRDGIFRHAQRLDASYHDRVPPGELMSRATSDSLLVARLVDNSGHTFGYLLTVVGVSGVLLWMDWRLALILLLPLPLLSIATWRYSGPYSVRSSGFKRSWARPRPSWRRRSPASGWSRAWERERHSWRASAASAIESCSGGWISPAWTHCSCRCSSCFPCSA
jgi:ABC-type multidrug transport system fused ATPase/permease subunit